MLKSVFFDFDGTLFHTEQVHQYAIQTVVENTLNQKMDVDELRAYVGLPYRDRLEHILAMRGIADDDLITELEKKATTLAQERQEKEALLVPGIRPLLEKLQKNNIQIAIVSSGKRSIIEQDLTEVGIEKYIDRITAIEDVVCRKPHPEPYEKTLAFFDVAAKDVIAFEDSPTGIESARLAGIRVIALRTTFGEEDLSFAEKTIQDYTQITLNDLLTL